MTTSKRLGGLWIVLGIQIALAIWLWWPTQSGAVTGQPWLAFKPAAVTRIAFTDGGKDKPTTLTLQKHAGRWQLPDAGHFPADATKVKHLLHAVAGLKGTLPVAVTGDAAKRFHVAKNQFRTRVTLDAGKKQVAKFYVGNAAGANLVYLRDAGSNVIEANQFPSWLASSSVSDWRDHDLLHVTGGKVTRLVLPKLTLTTSKDGWTAKGATTALDQSKAHSLVRRLAQLDYTKVDGKKPAHPPAPAFKASIESDGKTRVYAFTESTTKAKHAKAKSTTTWHVTRADLPWVFTVSADAATALRNADATSLAKPPAKPSPAHAATSPSTPAQ